MLILACMMYCQVVTDNGHLFDSQAACERAEHQLARIIGHGITVECMPESDARNMAATVNPGVKS